MILAELIYVQFDDKIRSYCNLLSRLKMGMMRQYVAILSALREGFLLICPQSSHLKPVSLYIRLVGPTTHDYRLYKASKLA